MVAILIGCQPSNQESSSPRILKDGLGREVHLPTTVSRVATLAPGVTEIVAIAGGLDLIVGVSNADNYPPAVLKLPNYSALPVNFEVVAALEPDVVFATTQVNNPRDASIFATLDIPVFYLASRTLEEVLDSIEMVGLVLGTSEAASDALSSLRDRIATLQARHDPAEIRPGVLFLISAEALHSFGPESYVHDLINLAGGRSVTSDLNVETPILSDEFVLSVNPDVIVGTFGEDFSLDSLLKYHPTWTLVSAVQRNRVFSIDADLILRAGPRIVDGAERLSSLIRQGQPKR
ncbi:MAG: ABC transporter substrate-binding protein [Rhodothermia bacterium]|nr:MAG: ABC transporter substrate-binding protein [Rhodothermia bacterium]